jgi:hypothetical protein
MRTRICRAAAVALLLCLPAGLAAGETRRGWRKAWVASVAAVVTVNVLDARTSAGRLEANPFLQDAQGRFSPGRAIAVKTVASGGMLLVQYLLHRRMPERRLEKPAALVNFAAAAAVGAVACVNTGRRF